MKKIAIVVQRYGEEICGGGEYYAKQLAEHLCTNSYDVEVITTTSLDYMTWDDYYPEGYSNINGVKVTRFAPEHERDWKLFNEYSTEAWKKINLNTATNLDDDEKWLDAQGPLCPQLLEYVKLNSKYYDVIFVITYIYYTAAKVIPLIADKCVFIPTAHDDVWIRLEWFKNLFHMPRYFAFLTTGEQDFVRKYFDNYCIPGRVVGFGVDVPPDANAQRFRDKFNINDRYIVYVGRVDISKSCDEMIDFFLAYKEVYHDDIKLVLVGKNNMEIPNRDDIICVGYVSEADKFDGIMGAEAMICPSKFESLCIALLEGMACGKPVLANKVCPILEEQCMKSSAGYAYGNKNEFINYMHSLFYDTKIKDVMRINALKFIENNYTWKNVLGKFNEIIDFVSEDKETSLGQRKRYMNRNIYSDIETERNIIKIMKPDDSLNPAFKEKNIVVCFTSSDEFAPVFSVALKSLIINTNPNWNYDINIFISDMSNSNLVLLKCLADGLPNISIRFINVQEMVKGLDYKIASYYNEFTYYRLFIPSIMKKYEKVLYLDSDLVINHDISELYNIDITDYYVAAAPELTVMCWQLLDKEHVMKKYLDDLGLNNPGGYIQGGVCLYNIPKFNLELPSTKLTQIATDKAFLMADQDIVNIHCKGKIKVISNKWNVVNMRKENEALYNKVLPEEFFSAYQEARKDPYIVHFSGQAIPCFQTNVDMATYFWKYAKNTPFYEQLIYHFREKRMFNIEEKVNSLAGVIVSNNRDRDLENKLVKVIQIINNMLPQNSIRRKCIKKIYNLMRRNK